MSIKYASNFESGTSEVFVISKDDVAKVQSLLTKNNISFAMAEDRDEAGIIASLANDRRYEFDSSWESSSC